MTIEPSGDDRLTADDRKELRRVMGNMPYGAGLVPLHWEIMDIWDVITFMERLADRLRATSEEHSRIKAERDRYRDAINDGARLVKMLMDGTD